MPNTYDKIATTTLGSSASSVTFSGISSNYTDLIVICSVAVSAIGFIKLNFNNDSGGTTYGTTLIEGDGGGAYSNKYANQGHIHVGGGNSLNVGANLPPTLININIQSYTNTGIYKTVLCRNSVQASSTLASTYGYAGLWRDTSVINRIDLSPSAGTWNSGSIFTIYGVKAA